MLDLAALLEQLAATPPETIPDLSPEQITGLRAWHTQRCRPSSALLILYQAGGPQDAEEHAFVAAEERRLRLCRQVALILGHYDGLEQLRKPSSARHSPDFRSVVWFGTPYDFTVKQAPVVELLWQAWKNGTPDVGQDTLLEKTNIGCKRLADLFKDHPAWGTMIRSNVRTKGSCRLQEPG